MSAFSGSGGTGKNRKYYRKVPTLNRIRLVDFRTEIYQKSTLKYNWPSRRSVTFRPSRRGDIFRRARLGTAWWDKFGTDHDWFKSKSARTVLPADWHYLFHFDTILIVYRLNDSERTITSSVLRPRVFFCKLKFLVCNIAKYAV